MKRIALSGLAVLALCGCGGSSPSTSSTPETVVNITVREENQAKEYYPNYIVKLSQSKNIEECVKNTPCLVDKPVIIKKDLHFSHNLIGTGVSKDDPSIILDGATLYPDDKVVIKDLKIKSKLLIPYPVPKQLYRGVAIAISGKQDIVIKNNKFIGFKLAIKAVNSEKITIESNKFDTLNGVYIKNSYDVNYVRWNVFYPYNRLDIYRFKTERNSKLRKKYNMDIPANHGLMSGYALKLEGRNDWPCIADNFSYGYSYIIGGSSFGGTFKANKIDNINTKTKIGTGVWFKDSTSDWGVVNNLISQRECGIRLTTLYKNSIELNGNTIKAVKEKVCVR